MIFAHMIDGRWVRSSVNGGGTIGFSFSPSNAAAAKGGTILFKNISNDIHSIIWDTTGSPANGPNFNTGGGTWSVPVPNSGTFRYHCGVHGPQMSGTISVTLASDLLGTRIRSVSG